jgi:flagellin-like protein
MKGVSEVIAIILILMIVIALAALAYTWFSGIFTQLTGTAGQTITSTTATMGTQFVLESAACNANPCILGSTLSFTIRNTGQPTFDATRTTFYIDGKPFAGLPACAPAATCVAATLANGCSYSCTRVLAATELPKGCGGTPATTSYVKAVIASGLEQNEIIVC